MYSLGRVTVVSGAQITVEADQPLTAGAIADTNSYALAALVREAGGEPRVLPIVRDDPALLAAAIDNARTADLIVSTGGVSVGEHEPRPRVKANSDAEFPITRFRVPPFKARAMSISGRSTLGPRSQMSVSAPFFMIRRAKRSYWWTSC